MQPNSPGTRGYNPYAYVANNPTPWLDPSGRYTSAEATTALRARNVDDAKAAGAEAMCYLCPMCRRVLSPDAEARELANYHIIELARMSLGELPFSPVAWPA